MSKVTNLIISFSIVEDEKSRTSEINLFTNNDRGFKINSADFEEVHDMEKGINRTRWYGGSKILETPLYVGAYNHLDLDKLMEHLKSINWLMPECVQIIVKEQDSEKFKIIGITD